MDSENRIAYLPSSLSLRAHSLIALTIELTREEVSVTSDLSLVFNAPDISLT